MTVLKRMLAADARTPSVVRKYQHNGSGVGALSPSTFNSTNVQVDALLQRLSSNGATIRFHSLLRHTFFVALGRIINQPGDVEEGADHDET